MDGKNWYCKKRDGHVLGVIQRQRVTREGVKRHIERLVLFRNAIDPGAASPADVDVIGVVEGFLPTVRCNVPGCGAERTWYPGEDAPWRLVEDG